MRYLVLALTLVLSQACGLKKKSKGGHEDVYQIFIQGDPQLLIAGNTTDTESFLTTNNKYDFDTFYSAGVALFAEKKIIKKFLVKN